MTSADYAAGAGVDPVIFNKASAILSDLGLSIPEAFRLMLTAIARDRCLPFATDAEEEAPNAETQRVMTMVERGEGVHYAKDAKDFLQQMGL